MIEGKKLTRKYRLEMTTKVEALLPRENVKMQRIEALT